MEFEIYQKTQRAFIEQNFNTIYQKNTRVKKDKQVISEIKENFCSSLKKKIKSSIYV